MNGLKITILQGVTVDQKKEYFFDQQHQYIAIGCDPEACDITFPEYYRDAGMGNEHIAFKRSLGRYQVDLNTDHYVAINGDVPFEDQEIAGTATIQLGESVTIEIQVIDQRTQPHQTRGKNPQPGEQIKRAKKYLWVSFVIIIGLLGAAVYFNGHIIGLESNIQVSDENIQRVTDRLQELSASLNRVETQAHSITRDTIEKISQSVYLVLIRNNAGGEQPLGTSWVIEGNRLATNAHVARAMAKLKSDEEMIVRSPVAPYRTHIVKDTLLHPGFAVFNEIWKDYLPCQKVGNKLALFETVGPADVAILYLEDDDGLSPPLPLATMDELTSIEPGMAVAFVGYPGESLLPGNNKKPVPVAQQDEVIRVTDFFQTRQNELPNRLIHHGLPVTGGASGSPMFNAEGKVIGIISSMNIARSFGSRSPNAADVNFGQRIDFLLDLLSQDLETRKERLRSSWRKSLAEYLPGFEVSNSAVLNGSARVFSVKEVKTQKTIYNDIDWEEENKGSVNIREKIALDQPGLYLLRLASKTTTSKIKVSPPGGKNITVCTPKIDFSNFAKYAFVIVGEPGDIQLSFKAAKSDDETQKRYQLDLTYWDEDLDSLVDSIVRYIVKVEGEGNEAETVKKVENLPMAKEIDGTYFAGFEIELQKKGTYIFSSVSLGHGELNIAILNAAKRIVASDKSINGLGLATLKNGADKQKINFVSYSKNKDVIQNMTVYFHPSDV